MGSSVGSIRSKMSTHASLESIHEEDPVAEHDGDDSDKEDTRHSTPSPSKRSRKITSVHSDASVSTLGQTVQDDSDRSSDEESE